MIVVGDAHFCLSEELRDFVCILLSLFQLLVLVLRLWSKKSWSRCLEPSTSIYQVTWMSLCDSGTLQVTEHSPSCWKTTLSSFLHNNGSFIEKKRLLQEPLNTRKKKTKKGFKLTALLIWLMTSLLKMYVKFVELSWEKKLKQKGAIWEWLLCKVYRQRKHTNSATKSN